jgi:hypothetical protein
MQSRAAAARRALIERRPATRCGCCCRRGSFLGCAVLYRRASRRGSRQGRGSTRCRCCDELHERGRRREHRAHAERKNAHIVLARGGLWMLTAEDNHTRGRKNVILRAVVTLSLGQPRSCARAAAARACPQHPKAPLLVGNFGWEGRRGEGRQSVSDHAVRWYRRLKGS